MPYVAATLSAVPTPEPTIERSIARGHVRGWCPGVLDPMETGDGWLLRIRIPGGFITPAALTLVGQIADDFGSGVVEITSRANLQIRGVASGQLDQATAAVVAADLVGHDARSDAFRSVVANPLTGHDPRAAGSSRPLVHALVDRLTTDISRNAPSKFGIVIDDGGSWDLGDLDADITLRACGAGMWAVFLRSASEAIGWTVNPTAVAVTATQWCVDEASRMDQLVASVGCAGIAERLALAAPSGDAGLHRRASGPGRIIGVLPHVDPMLANVVAAPFLGRTDAAMLAGIAELATTHNADLRLTPDHSVAFCGVRAQTVTALVSELLGFGLVVDNDDPRALLSACVGSRGCASALADTWAVGHRLAAASQRTERFHLSACAKRCGAPVGVRHLVADESGAFHET